MRLRTAPRYRRLVACFLIVAHLLLIVPVTPTLAAAAERVLFYHDDALGSPVAMTDASGSVVWRADYQPFGGVAAESGTVGNTHQFTGKERDPETGLQYFGARFYDGGIGRFLSVDPALLRGQPASALQSPQRLNLYAYSANNPYRFVDPTGKYLETAIDVVSLGLSIQAYRENPSLLNKLAVGADSLALALPLVPGGAGLVLKALKGAENVAEVARSADKAELAARLAENAARGGAFERAVLEALGQAKNTTKVTGAFRGGVGRAIPDILKEGVTDIKDVVDLTFTRQLQIEYDTARAAGEPFSVIVSPRTRNISQPLKRAVRDTGGTIQRFDPGTGTLTEIKIEP